jgi:hypothetical protein
MEFDNVEAIKSVVAVGLELPSCPAWRSAPVTLKQQTR